MQNPDLLSTPEGLTAPAILRPKKACAYLDISIATFWRFAKNDPAFPTVFKIGPNASAIMREDLDAWLKAKREAAQ